MPMRLVLISLSALIGVAGCGSPDIQNGLKEAWSQSSAPTLFESNYEFRFEQLPRDGRSEGPRWSGDYWPSAKGGIAQRWKVEGGLKEKAAYTLLKREQLATIDGKSLSPAEKYDIFAGDYSFSLTRFERARTRVLATIAGQSEYIPGFDIASWEGLCHGWAPASITYQEPAPVTLSNPDGVEVSFGSADIKALLTYAMHEGVGSHEEMLGTRCEVDFGKLQRQLKAGEISQEAYEKAKESLPCRDTNPGSFHVILANEIGKRKQSFVADVTRDTEVWNQGVVSYRSEAAEMKAQRSPGAAPETVYEVEVKTQIDYITEIMSTWEANGSTRIYEQADYRYRLELNAAKEIVGGQWLSEARPDFIWRKSRPLVSSRLSALPAIYQAATGQSFFAGGNAPSQPTPRPPVVQPPTDPTPPRPMPPAPSSGASPSAPRPPLPSGACRPADPWCLG